MTEGPFLYEDGPEPLHTGSPRRSGKLLVLVFGATALVAVLMVVLLPLVKGSAGDQSREVVQVFLAALDCRTPYGRDGASPGGVPVRHPPRRTPTVASGVGDWE